MPIDLLNVAFENPRKIRVQTEGNVDALPKKQKNERKRVSANNHIALTYNVPDRKTGLEELEELRRLCPGRTWNFVSLGAYIDGGSWIFITQVEINVPYEVSPDSFLSVVRISVNAIKRNLKLPCPPSRPQCGPIAPSWI
jgi:hypothetical protein